MVHNRLRPSSNGAAHVDATTGEQLLACFKRIEDVWKRAEEKMASTHVPVDVRIKADDGPLLHDSPTGCPSQYGVYARYLTYCKVKGTKRICVETIEETSNSIDEDCRPVTECPV